MTKKNINKRFLDLTEIISEIFKCDIFQKNSTCQDKEVRKNIDERVKVWDNMISKLIIAFKKKYKITLSEKYIIFIAATNVRLGSCAKSVWSEDMDATYSFIAYEDDLDAEDIKNFFALSECKEISEHITRMGGSQFFDETNENIVNVPETMEKTYRFNYELGRQFFVGKNTNLANLDKGRQIAIYKSGYEKKDTVLLLKLSKALANDPQKTDLYKRMFKNFEFN